MRDPDEIKAEADAAARSGQFDNARDLYLAALAQRPDWVAAHNNLAMVMRQLGDMDAAEKHFRTALDHDPGQVGAMSNLGALLVEQARLDEATPVLTRARELAPDHPGVLYNWALLAGARGDDSATVTALEGSIAHNPNFAPAHSNLGIAYRNLGRMEAAKTALERAIVLDPNLLEAHINLAATLAAIADTDGALAAGLRAIELDPTSAEAHYNVGNAYNRIPDFEVALRHFDEALKLNPMHSEAANNRAKSLGSLGRRAEAVQALRLAQEIESDYPAANSNIVLFQQYDSAETPETLFAAARGWNARYGLHPAPPRLVPADVTPDRPLRVAYLSPHLTAHPVGFFLEPVLAHHSRSQVEAVCYADAAKEDAQSAKLRATGVTWIDVRLESDAALINRLRADHIDILVDLDGHTGPNRLPVFAGRAAPLQVTWAGYVGTTGLDEMDYLITDHRQTTDADLTFMTEQPVYMPGNYVTLAPIAPAPEVGPCPSDTNGYVTFGCFNNLDKLNPQVIALWARVMTAVPASRLRMITFDLGDPAVAARIAAQFADHGIPSDRLTLEGKRPRPDLFAAYNTIDVALDPFPYSGGLTTLEALWMGVPVITKRDGDRFAARHSVTHLTAIGMTDCIADDAEDYLVRAAALAADAALRQQLRATLRETMRASPACNGAAFTRALEKAYRIMWQRFCAAETPSPITAQKLSEGPAAVK
jgi:protein O-GlcNAc transferase